MTASCFASIVVSAYNRRGFYADAVNSVLPLLSSRSDIEIILLRNFEEEEVDRRLEAQGVRVCFESSPIVGSTLRRSFELCNGDYIAFLDDDDLFKPSKLARFEQVLRRFPSLGYYHNEYEYALENKSGLGAWERLTIDHSYVRRAEPELAAFGGSGDPTIFSYLAYKNREQNLSSTIVHRDVATGILPWLNAFPVMTDTIMLTAGLISKKTLVFDSSIETVARRHAENSSNRLKHLELRLGVLEALTELCAVEVAPQDIRDYLTLRTAREIVYLGTSWRNHLKI